MLMQPTTSSCRGASGVAVRVATGSVAAGALVPVAGPVAAAPVAGGDGAVEPHAASRTTEAPASRARAIDAWAVTRAGRTSWLPGSLRSGCSVRAPLRGPV